MEKDLIHVLAENHAVLGWLADRVEAAPAGRARAVLFNALARALAAHQTVVDHTVLPSLKSIGWGGVTSDVLSGHMALRRLLAEVVSLERNAAVLDGAVLRLARQAKVQCAQERTKLLPTLRRFDDDQRALLALEAEQHLRRLLGDAPRMQVDADIGPGAADLVEEAYVVLGSLPARERRPHVRR